MSKTEKIEDSSKVVHGIEKQSEDDSKRDETQHQKGRDIKDDPCITEELSVYTKFYGHNISKGYDEEKIKIGLRVVRPHYIKPKGDNTEIGTIVSISKSGDIQVQWDKTDNYDTIAKNNCNKQYKLLLFDNAQTGVKHTFLQCNACNECPLRGIRWKCMKCVKINLCTYCYMHGKHTSSHVFKRIISSNSKGVQMSPRENLRSTCAYGIIPFADVQLRQNNTPKGRVQQFIDKKINMFRSDAQVEWTDNSKGQYCVGRDGICELKFTKPTNGLKFYEYHLPSVTNENTQKGARVVNFSKDDFECGQDDRPVCVGTVTNIGHMDTQVKWDDGTTNTSQLKNTNLLLLDNGPSGIQHKDYFCDGCQNPNTGNIRGIRWNCMECDNVDLCTKCYMSDTIRKTCKEHKFKRFVSEEKGEKMQVARSDRTLRKQSVGIFKLATVDETTGETAKKHGTVVQICNYNLDAVRSEVEVSWEDKTTSCHPILDFKLLNGGKVVFYHDHLPILGTDFHGYFDVDFVLNGDCTKKIQVDIWRTVKPDRKLTYKPTLYLIFANHSEVDKADEKMALMEEVIDFAKKTKLPCHVLGQRVLFHSGSTNTVFIHQKTDIDTIKILVNKGFRKFGRGDIIDKEEEIYYFIRMAEYALGETILPVIISLRNGGMTTGVLKSAEVSKIPIVRLKKQSLDVTVLTYQTIEMRENTTDQAIEIREDTRDQYINMREHRTDSKNPWKVKGSKERNYKLNTKKTQDDQDEISLISEIQFGFRSNLDDLVCFLIIGVSMEGESLGKIENGTYGDIYPNALSMYLLKEGKWRIPKEHVKKSFSYKSLEYIYEKDMKSEITSKDGLWSQLKFKTGMAYKTPDYTELQSKTVKRKSENTRSEGATYTCLETEPDTIELQSKTASRKSDDARNESAMDSSLNTTYPLIKGPEIALNVSTSELFGLILFALLQKKCYSGAQQLIETGCIRIHDILIGCSILEDEANDRKTTPSMKKRLQRLKTAFTQRAIQITLCVYGADKNKLEIDIKQREENFVKHQDDSEDKENKELGDYINHAGRLLLNHGYLENAIKTENKTFIDHVTIKDILSTMWYYKEEFDFPTTLRFFFLAVFHVILMPLLMINMEAPPLLWFYKKYKLPFMKVFMHMLGFLVLLSAYSYMLLFNYSEDGITYTDYFIIALFASFFLDESKQSIVAIVRGKWSSYAKSNWNRIDWLSMIAYTSGMLSKLGDGSHYRNASSVLLVAAFILLCIRILNWFCISSVLGPTLVMIQEMFLDTFAFMTIMTVIMMCYNISYYALLYPNSEFTWSQMEKIIQNGYWMLFGELNLDGDKLTEPDCTFNRTIYESGVLQQCPSQLGVNLTPYLKAFYGLIAVILLLNLLIAMYSNTFDNVHQESRFHWSQLQTDFLEEYSIKTIFPIHLQLLVLPATIIHAILWFSSSYICPKCSSKDKEKKDEATLNHCPMFVRVFLYNTNFDLNLKATREAEGAGALEAKGRIDFMEVDSVMQEQHENDETHRLITKISTKQDNVEKSLTEIEKLILTKQQNMEKKLEEIQKLLSTIAKSEEKKDTTVPESL